MCAEFKRLVVAVWLAAFLMLTAAPAFADGCYMAQKAVRKIPAISAQRALLKWKDGEETLVIASTLDSESQSLGWIIPLPSVPGEITKADPGALKTLEFCVQPRITFDLTGKVAGAVLGLVFLLTLAVMIVYVPGRFVRFLFFLIWILLLFAIAVPNFLRARKRGEGTPYGSTLRVEKTARVGSYDIAVLSAKNTGDLNAWLADNGFTPFPDAAGPAVANYISRNWVFAVIKLTREGTGENTPHPIAMTFKSGEAIYPLQLTALPGGAPAFELFVLGSQRADSGLLKTEYCDKYNAQKHESLTQKLELLGAAPEAKPRHAGLDADYEYFMAADSLQRIGQPDICKLMWDGCVLTKLSGTIAAGQMTDDLRIKWTDYRPYRQHLYTPGAAAQAASVPCLWLLGGFMFISLLLDRKRARAPRGFLHWAGGRVLPAVLISGVAALAWYKALPKIDPGEVTMAGRNRILEDLSLLGHIGDIDDLFEKDTDIFKKSETEIANAILASFAKSAHGGPVNPYLGTDVTVESTPGNFTVVKQGSKVLVSLYDEIGHPSVLEYEPGGSKPQSTPAGGAQTGAPP